MADALTEKRMERMRTIENIEAVNAQIAPLAQQREALIRHSAKLQQEIAALSAQAKNTEKKDPPKNRASQKKTGEK